MQHYDTIRELIDRVRRRWRTQQAFEAIARASLAAIVVVAVALIAALWTSGKPGALATIGIAAVVLTLAAIVWGLLPLRRVPGDRQVARFIEERSPELDDRLVSAVDVATGERQTPLAAPMLADAARRASDVEASGVIPTSTLRRAGLQAATVMLMLVGIL